MKRTFTVPDNLTLIAKEIVCAVIDAIPSGWAVVRGILHAPESMLASGEAIRTTKFVFKASIDCMIDRADDAEGPVDVFGTLFEGKSPVSVEFGEIFGTSGVMPMDQHKRTAARFVRLGYRGRLEFTWRLSEDRDPDPFSCEIWMPSRDKDTAPTISIEAHGEDYLASGGTVAPIVAICEAMKLVEHQPAHAS